MPFASGRDGTQIYYELTEPDGVSDPSSLPTVVFTHGFCSGSDLWKAQVKDLRSSGRYRAAVWDMRGHAKSGCPEDPAAYSKMEQMHDTLSVLLACGVSPEMPAILVGHSMGGYDNMLFYFKFPEYVRALVLYGTGPGFAKDAGRQGWNKTAEKLALGFDEQGLEALKGSDKTKGHANAKGLALVARGNFAQRDDDELFQELADGPLHCAKHLADIHVPARVIVGERDKAFTASSEMLAKKLPRATLVKVPGSGHMCAETNPDKFNTELFRCLGELTQGPDSKL